MYNNSFKQRNKIKHKIYQTVVTVSKYNREIIERGKSDPP